MATNIVEHLVCPRCKSEVNSKGDSLWCSKESCGLRYSVKQGIPVMLTAGGDISAEESGYYPKISGGTMEDNPDPKFVEYDTRIRTHYLRRYLKGEPREGLLLDLCCSKAPFSPYLGSLGYSGKIFGADLLFNQLLVAKERGVRAVQANALWLPFPDEHFRTVIFTDALVHLMKRQDQIAVFNEISRILKRGGCLISTATSLRHGALKSFLSDTNCLQSDYCTYFSLEDVESLTKDHFTLERFDAFGFYPYFKGITRNAAVCYGIDRLLNNSITKKFGMVYYFKHRRE